MTADARLLALSAAVRGGDYSQVLPALAAEQYCIARAARRLGVPPRTMAGWCARYRELRAAVDAARRSGGAA